MRSVSFSYQFQKTSMSSASRVRQTRSRRRRGRSNNRIRCDEATSSTVYASTFLAALNLKPLSVAWNGGDTVCPGSLQIICQSDALPTSGLRSSTCSFGGTSSRQSTRTVQPASTSCDSTSHSQLNSCSTLTPSPRDCSRNRCVPRVQSQARVVPHRNVVCQSAGYRLGALQHLDLWVWRQPAIRRVILRR